MKKILLSLIFLAFATCLFAQPQYYNYNEEGTANSFPFNQGPGKRIQTLIKPGDFNQPNSAPSGNITHFYCRITTYGLGPATYSGFNIKFGQTTALVLPSSFITLTDTVYYRSSVTLTAAPSTWLAFTLDTPYPYDSTKSLIIEIEQCGATGTISGYSLAHHTGMPITGNGRSYSLTAPCTAPYSGLTTGRVVNCGVDIQSGPPPQPRNVLLEFCTGTWCPWCPCGHTTADALKTTYTGLVALAYHGGGSDPYQNFNGNAVRSLLGFAAYPTGIIDRMNHPGNGTTYPYVDYTQWTGLTQTRYQTSPTADVGLNVTSVSYYPPTRQLKVMLDATAQANLNGTYKLQYVLTEDGMIYPQSGNGTCPGGTNYVHELVVRDMVNGASGETISTGAWNQNVTYSDTLTTTLDPSWIWSNCSINMFVYRDSTSQLYFSHVAQATDTSLSSITGITNPNLIPDEYILTQNYPNPFNPITNIHFSIPKGGNVSLKFYDIRGKEIAVYVDGFLNAGKYNAEFDGSGLSSGVYFYKLVAGDFTATKKMILTK
ncbi:Omp28-related outer membrane protein [Bacteroidota bacterium]